MTTWTVNFAAFLKIIHLFVVLGEAPSSLKFVTVVSARFNTKILGINALEMGDIPSLKAHAIPLMIKMA